MSRSSKIVGSIALVFLAVGLLWRPVVEPQVVRFPAGLNRTEHYQGTFVLFVDQSTGAALAQPVTVPLTIDRQLKGTSTGAHVALVKETDTLTMGATKQVVENVYAIDRRSMKNVSDPKAYTFTPSNVVDRSNTYRLTYPMGVKSKGAAYQIFKPETGTAYTIVNGTPATGKVSGTNVVFLSAVMGNTPVAPYENAALAARGLPTQLNQQQLTAQLKAAGIDLTKVSAQLATILTPAQMATLGKAIATPVPLKYFSAFHGNVAVEPKTGQMVEISNVSDGIYVQPDFSALAPLTSVLAPYAANPAVASLLTTFSKAAASEPQPVYQLRYSQTPASVATDAKDARDRASQVQLAKVTLPRVILGIAALLLIAFAVLVWRRGEPGTVHGVAPSPEVPGQRAA